MLVQHLVVPLGLAAIAVHRVVEALRRRELEMHGLAGERTEARGDEQEPGEQLWPVRRGAEELARFFREIDQDRRGVEDARFLTVRSLRIDDRRHLAVGVDRTEGRRVLLALTGVDGNGLVGEARFFQEEGDLRGVWCRVKIEPDHRYLLLVWGIVPADALESAWRPT